MSSPRPTAKQNSKMTGVLLRFSGSGGQHQTICTGARTTVVFVAPPSRTTEPQGDHRRSGRALPGACTGQSSAPPPSLQPLREALPSDILARRCSVGPYLTAAAGDHERAVEPYVWNARAGDRVPGGGASRCRAARRLNAIVGAAPTASSLAWQTAREPCGSDAVEAIAAGSLATHGTRQPPTEPGSLPREVRRNRGEPGATNLSARTARV